MTTKPPGRMGITPHPGGFVSAEARIDLKGLFHLSMADANKRPCGGAETSNKRVINQFIHPDVLPTCQLSMGLTQLEPGSVWNTMPAHTHERRGLPSGGGHRPDRPLHLCQGGRDWIG